MTRHKMIELLLLLPSSEKGVPMDEGGVGLAMELYGESTRRTRHLVGKLVRHARKLGWNITSAGGKGKNTARYRLAREDIDLLHDWLETFCPDGDVEWENKTSFSPDALAALLMEAGK